MGTFELWVWGWCIASLFFGLGYIAGALITRGKYEDQLNEMQASWRAKYEIWRGSDK